MTTRIRWKGWLGKGWLAGPVALVVAALAFAWFDGGHEPLRDIVEPVPLPAPAR